MLLTLTGRNVRARPKSAPRIIRMEPLYRPEGVEERWQETWEAEGLYEAHAERGGPTFVIAHPPPNVTGELHMGHALQLALADTLVRMKRMQGFNTLFQPGYDHAGISTQNAVEKDLAREGKTRHDLGREAFEARVWEWLRLYGRTIMTQFRRIGASLDYRRERFTMDDDYVRAVMRFFVHLYGKGWIYRANRIINWCPFHETSLSDLELVHVERRRRALLHHVSVRGRARAASRSRLRGPPRFPADVAVAVHPDDERYRDAVGREVVVPYVEKPVPVIADEAVEPEFGTGALKVTPGHDPLDFEIGRRHELPEPMVVGPDGRMNDAGRRSRRADAGGGGRAHRRLGKGARAAREAGELSPFRRALRALRVAHRAADLAAVVVLDGRSSRSPLSPRSASGRSSTTPSRSIASPPTRSRTRRTGTSRASSGGATSCRSGTAPTGT